eukprot:2620108-Ditylum_brightwellii.AAC.1
MDLDLTSDGPKPDNLVLGSITEACKDQKAPSPPDHNVASEDTALSPPKEFPSMSLEITPNISPRNSSTPQNS